MANATPSAKIPVQLTPAQASAGMQTALQDNSRFIRTMAKDMAMLTGGQPIEEEPTKKKKRREKEDAEFVSGVALPVREQPFFERQMSRAERDMQEPAPSVALPAMTEASAIVASGPGEIAQRVADESLDPAPFAPFAPLTPTEDRETILARLRNKVEETGDMTIATPQSASGQNLAIPPRDIGLFAEPPAAWGQGSINEIVEERKEPAFRSPVSLRDSFESRPAPEAPAISSEINAVADPVQTPTPEAPTLVPATELYREPIEVAPTAPAAATTFTLQPLSPQPLQTYASNFSDRIDRDNASAFAVLAAEQDAGRSTPIQDEPVRRRINLAPIIGGVIFVLLGGAGAFGAYQLVMTVRETPFIALSVPSIVSADEYKELEGSGTTLVEALVSTANTGLVSGNVLVTYTTIAASSEEGGFITKPSGGDTFIRALQLNAPDILLRNITDRSTVGVVRAGQETRPFFALRVESYERTYAGMLTWEPLLFSSLSRLFPLHQVSVPAIEEPIDTESVSTTTATTSTAIATSTPTIPPVAPSQAIARTRFEDMVIDNKDVRVLKDTNNQTLLLYGYADKRTLIIARDEAAFRALINRLKPE